VEASIGHYQWEQAIKQIIKFDLELFFDVKHAAMSDDLADTVDYTVVIKKVQELASSRSFALVEALTEAVATLMLKDFKVEKVRVRADKIAVVPDAKQVGVVIERP
jgi:dihydroneopterin aldolase